MSAVVASCCDCPLRDHTESFCGALCAEMPLVDEEVVSPDFDAASSPMNAEVALCCDRSLRGHMESSCAPDVKDRASGSRSYCDSGAPSKRRDPGSPQRYHEQCRQKRFLQPVASLLGKCLSGTAAEEQSAKLNALFATAAAEDGPFDDPEQFLRALISSPACCAKISAVGLDR